MGWPHWGQPALEEEDTDQEHSNDGEEEEKITDPRDTKCNRPNVVGKDEDYYCQRCVNIL